MPSVVGDNTFTSSSALVYIAGLVVLPSLPPTNVQSDGGQPLFAGLTKYPAGVIVAPF